MNMQQVLINMHENRKARFSEWLLRGNDVLD